MSEDNSYKVSDSLYLVRHVRDTKAPAKPVDVSANHIVVIDCSGSMSGDLPKIREQLKKKLPKLLKEKDTISIVWFSGRGQFGTLIEAEPVATLADLKDVNAAIDRWLKPIGLTGFKEPLEEVSALVGRVAKKNNNIFSLFFMSDGHDNQWGRPEILKAVEKAAGGLSSATFVEYGYYADRPLLTSMAEKAGGTLIFSDDFDKYAPMFEAAMQRKLSGAPRVEEKIAGDPIRGFVWTMGDGDLTTYGVEAGSVSIPQDVGVLYYLSSSKVGKETDAYEVGASYAAISLFSVRMVPDVVFPFLKLTGDIAFIEAFAGCFGKQKYSEFMDAAKAAAFDESKRLVKGFDPNKVPREDAFTVLDLLRVLSGDDGNRIMLDSPDFKYSRIGRGRIDSSTLLTEDEQAEVEKLSAEIAKTKDAKKIRELADKISIITAGKEALKFTADPAPDGCPISNLTYNEDRPNVSFLVKKSGTVDITPRLKGDLLKKLPQLFPTFIYRNYAVVKDGLVNIEILPVRLTQASYNKIKTEIPVEAMGLDTNIGGGIHEVILNLRVLPVINRKMVKNVSAKDFFLKSYELTKAQAAQKVFNAYKKEHFPRESKGFVETYDKETADWLKEQGITDYSGFSPKSVQAESSDFYMGKELKVSLKGLSSLPSLREAKEKIAKGKPNPPTLLMQPAIDEAEAFLKSDTLTRASDGNHVLETWINDKVKEATTETRRLIREIAETTFALIVGQIWFIDFKSLDENTLTVPLGGSPVDCKAELLDIKINI